MKPLMTAPTIALSAENLDAGVEALSRAAQAFKLTRFERIWYRMLMISADTVALCLITQMIVTFVAPSNLVIGVLSTVFTIGVLLGIVSLLLIHPFICKDVPGAKEISRTWS